jgi:hypothetical protein
MEYFWTCKFDMKNNSKIFHFFLFGFILSFLLNATGNKAFCENSEIDTLVNSEYQTNTSNTFSGLQIAPAGIEDPFHAFPSTFELKEEIEEEDNHHNADLVISFILADDAQNISNKALVALPALIKTKLYLLFHQLKTNC